MSNWHKTIQHRWLPIKVKAHRNVGPAKPSMLRGQDLSWSTPHFPRPLFSLVMCHVTTTPSHPLAWPLHRTWSLWTQCLSSVLFRTVPRACLASISICLLGLFLWASAMLFSSEIQRLPPFPYCPRVLCFTWHSQSSLLGELPSSLLSRGSWQGWRHESCSEKTGYSREAA